jgi:hypothetical protein
MVGGKTTLDRFSLSTAVCCCLFFLPGSLLLVFVPAGYNSKDRSLRMLAAVSETAGSIQQQCLLAAFSSSVLWLRWR